MRAKRLTKYKARAWCAAGYKADSAINAVRLTMGAYRVPALVPHNRRPALLLAHVASLAIRGSLKSTLADWTRGRALVARLEAVSALHLLTHGTRLTLPSGKLHHFWGSAPHEAHGLSSALSAAS